MANEKLPLVSIICVCYQHKAYITNALRSVVQQTYPHCELIIVDNGSTDGSVEEIKFFLTQHPDAQAIFFEQTKTYPAAFNEGLKRSKGDYIIDLAGDDMLLSQRAEWAVEKMQEEEGLGVQFTDAILISQEGHYLGLHSDAYPHESIPQGMIYEYLLSRYFLLAPTMCFRRKMLEEVGGYDASLHFEDFDTWVRTAQRWKYQYIPIPTVRRRIHDKSLSQAQKKGKNAHLMDVYKVCCKAFLQHTYKKEERALLQRIRYEMGHALRQGRWAIAGRYLILSLQILLRYHKMS
ncbi:glycosyltransferase [Cytophagales bacterium LB-30]|uniref:Glycosyltransferase n=1 Tax=Shiella aurantiaca TaxID=3058365 RepID=A0ABT8F981_9BACT|nr:glycosyltransferase [Shiella aurantiaca]MDN4166924.1 glycosyltransferase [Shiella aurantiaca]